MTLTLTIDKIPEEKSSNWNLFIEGDNESITVIYKQYFSKLLFVAYRYLNDQEKAKDVVSEVFEKFITMEVAEREQKLSGVDEKLESFLKVIVKNRCINLINIEKNRRGIIKHISFFRAVNTQPYELQNEDLQKMLELLPFRQKEILTSNINGLKNHEIAEKLNISEQTVKNTLVNSKKKIKEIYNTFMV